MTVEIKDFLSPLATLVSVLVGFGGVVWSLRAAGRNQKSKQAFDAYDTYLKDCFAYPRLANGQLVEQNFQIPQHYRDGKDDFYKYEWFVARLMSAAEQILDVVPNDDEWREAIKSQVKKHSVYIESRYFQPEIYSKPLCKIITELKAERKALGKP